MRKQLIIIAASLFALILIVFLYMALDNQRTENKQLKTIISSKDVQISNNANQVEVWQVKYSDLENAHKKQINERSVIELKLAKAYADIAKYKRKEKDLIGYNSFDITATDTIYLEMPVECSRIDPIKTKHIDLSFSYNVENDLTNISYVYRANVNTIVMLAPQRKLSGKKHFPNWGFIWGWETNSITTIDDTNATITNNVSIDFKR